MAIPQEVKDRFQRLFDAAKEDNLCVVEVTRTGKRKGKKAYAICEGNLQDDGGLCMVPLGEIPVRDPFEMFKPPEGVNAVGK